LPACLALVCRRRRHLDSPDWLTGDLGGEGDGMSAPPLVLVPPSKSMQPGGRGQVRPGSGTFRRLSGTRRELVAAVADRLAAEPERAATLFGATGALLDRAQLAFDRLASWTAPALPAVERFTGVVWDHLDPSTLDDQARSHLLVPNAVMGLSAGLDPVPDHRLGFATSVGCLGRLDRWWRPRLTEVLADALSSAGTLVDMLPQEHAAAIDLEALAARGRVVHVRFLSPGGRAAAGHAAKAVKGIAARVALTEGVDGLAGFRWAGWRARRGDDGHVAVIAP
jgi:uncharacterized protein